MTDVKGPVRFPWPPVLLVAAGCIAILAGSLYALPWPRGPFGEFLVAIGVMIAGAGVVLIALTARKMHRMHTSILPTHVANRLVTDGPFAISRNPIYLGMAAILFGLAPITGNLWFAVLAVLFSLAVSMLVIRPEERHLEQRFGKAYRDYAKRVRRWF